MMNTQLDKHKALASTVCCPNCHGGISWPEADSFAGVPVNGTLICNQCGPVGHAANLKLIFNAAPPAIRNARRESLQGLLHVAEHPPQLSDASPAGAWNVDGARVWSAQPGARILLPIRGEGMGLLFLKHSWAGLVRISLNGQLLDTLDLLEENGSAQYWHPVYTGGVSGTVQIEVVGEKNEKSSAAQVFFLGHQLLEVRPSNGTSINYPSSNRGNPYPRQFASLLAAQAPDALVLDCGSGDRSYPDARVVNFEYSQFSAPDVFGDGHRLPFRDNSFDFILSQAVIEHLYNPFQAVDEIHRVLKPGGLVYAESAFMQPLHAVPYHFYNTTGWGLSNLFKEFEVVDARHAGTLGQTLRWIYGITKLREKGHGEKLDQLLSMVEELDNDITDAELKSFASFVTITARKKGGPTWTA